MRFSLFTSMETKSPPSVFIFSFLILLSFSTLLFLSSVKKKKKDLGHFSVAKRKQNDRIYISKIINNPEINIFLNVFSICEEGSLYICHVVINEGDVAQNYD